MALPPNLSEAFPLTAYKKVTATNNTTTDAVYEAPTADKGVVDTTNNVPMHRAFYITGIQAYLETSGASATYITLYDATGTGTVEQDQSSGTVIAVLGLTTGATTHLNPGEVIGPFFKGVRAVLDAAGDVHVNLTVRAPGL